MTKTTHEGTVGGDWLDGTYTATVTDDTWNGWAIPAFTRQVAGDVITDMMRHDLEMRGFMTLTWHTEDGVDYIHIHDESADVVEFIAPDPDGLYPLGAYSWTWWEE